MYNAGWVRRDRSTDKERKKSIRNSMTDSALHNTTHTDKKKATRAAAAAAGLSEFD